MSRLVFDRVGSQWLFRFMAISLGLLVSGSVAEGWQRSERVSMEEEFKTSGTVSGLKPGQITVVLADGKSLTCKVQNKGEDALSLEGGQIIVSLPAKIQVGGAIAAGLLEPGMQIQCHARLNKKGKVETPIREFLMTRLELHEMRVQNGDSLKADEFTPCDIAGRVISLSGTKMTLFVQKSKVSPDGRIVLEIDPTGTLEIHDDSLNRVVAGDQVTSMTVVKFSNGDQVVKEIEITFTGKRKKATASVDDLLEQKHSKLSDEPRESRMVKSDHFILYTDISDRSAAILLDKLERMYVLIGRYYGKRPRKPIECYVVSDLRNFSGLPPAAALKIAEPAGITFSRAMVEVRDGDIVDVESVVYSCDKHGVVQHEAVHCYCNLTFGDAGPIWYAEGMAEMGQYWKPDELGVNIDPVVMDYLTHNEKKSLAEIVAPAQITGDSWQAYAWRWTLCHLLASHPTHSAAFRRLGVEMMTGGKATFESTYGPVARQLTFEYDQFVRNMGNGYRVDLCVWDFATQCSQIVGNERIKCHVQAGRGWQASTLQVEKGKSYDYVAQGEWVTAEGETAIDANGDSRGRGQLVGAVFVTSPDGYELLEEIELGVKGSLIAPAAGHLYLRCRDDWTELADNQGDLTLHFRVTPKSATAGEQN